MDWTGDGYFQSDELTIPIGQKEWTNTDYRQESQQIR